MRQELTRHDFARIRGGHCSKIYSPPSLKIRSPSRDHKKSPHESVSDNQARRANFPRNGGPRGKYEVPQGTTKKSSHENANFFLWSQQGLNL